MPGRLSHEGSSHRTWKPVRQEVTVQERGCCSTADYPMRCNTSAGLSQQAVPGEAEIGQILTKAHPTDRDPVQSVHYHDYEPFIHPEFAIYPIKASLSKVWICGTSRERPRPRPRSLPRKQYVVVSHQSETGRACGAMGDGLRFHVSETGDCLTSRSHTHFDRGLCGQCAPADPASWSCWFCSAGSLAWETGRRSKSGHLVGECHPGEHWGVSYR